VQPVMRIGAVDATAWGRVLTTPPRPHTGTSGAAPVRPDRSTPGGTTPEPRDRPQRAASAPGEAVADAARFWFFGGRTPGRERPPGAPLSLGHDRATAAARALGLGPYASQEEIDRRFREIVKAERPDLGTMRPEALHRLAEQRDLLRDAASRATRTALASRFATTATSAALGTTLDVAG
jgi:hypothetical protein